VTAQWRTIINAAIVRADNATSQLTTPATVVHEGALSKAGKSLYFVLSTVALSWFRSELDAKHDASKTLKGRCGDDRRKASTTRCVIGRVFLEDCRTELVMESNAIRLAQPTGERMELVAESTVRARVCVCMCCTDTCVRRRQ
jgi:hypothetical protein